MKKDQFEIMKEDIRTIKSSNEVRGGEGKKIKTTEF